MTYPAEKVTGELSDNDVHELPEATSTERPHELERDCWCHPLVVCPVSVGNHRVLHNKGAE